MTVNASKIPSVVAMSAANIKAKRELRHWLRDYAPELTKCLDALGDDPIINRSDNADLTGRIQHVDLGDYHEQVGQAAMLVSQALNILTQMHNAQTTHGESIGIKMDAPNGGGGGR